MDLLQHRHPHLRLLQDGNDLLHSKTLPLDGKTSPLPPVDFAGNSLTEWIKSAGAARGVFVQMPHQGAQEERPGPADAGYTCAAALIRHVHDSFCKTGRGPYR